MKIQGLDGLKRYKRKTALTNGYSSSAVFGS
nr:MAG TPA: hypothetical protein [Caudoviricetes sp.]